MNNLNLFFTMQKINMRAVSAQLWIKDVEY